MNTQRTHRDSVTVGLPKRRAAKKFLFVRDDARDAVIEECASAVPSNWLDSLLPKTDNMPLNCAGIERLLKGVAARIRELKSKP